MPGLPAKMPANAWPKSGCFAFRQTSLPITNPVKMGVAVIGTVLALNKCKDFILTRKFPG
jgi:hypothetical protein